MTASEELALADLALLHLDSFLPLVGAQFEVAAADGECMLGVLTNAEDRGSNERLEQFALLFSTERLFAIGQSTYRLSQPAIGALDLFLVPVGLDAGGAHYEAVFSRFRGAPAPVDQAGAAR